VLDIFLQTVPFFGVMALGYGAAAAKFFPDEATKWLTRFVFYFALSAMLFRFSANLDLPSLFDARFAFAYLAGTAIVYILATFVARVRKRRWEEAAFEAQCASIGNVGFMGIPLLTLLLGIEAVPYVMFVLSIDLIIFGSLIVIVVTGVQDGKMSLRVIGSVSKGLIKNPMIVSIALGLLWSQTGMGIPATADQFLALLGGAATPCALFAIGASLAGKSAERASVAVWLSFAKLVIHPVAVAIAAIYVFDVDAFPATVMIAAAALPTAGNIYILARHYGFAAHRVSSTILFSTIASVVTLSLVVGWLSAY
jgi:malonate transporter